MNTIGILITQQEDAIVPGGTQTAIQADVAAERLNNSAQESIATDFLFASFESVEWLPLHRQDSLTSTVAESVDGGSGRGTLHDEKLGMFHVRRAVAVKKLRKLAIQHRLKGPWQSSRQALADHGENAGGPTVLEALD
jgi:hypothetical protein